MLKFAIYLDHIPVNRSLIPSSFVVMYMQMTFLTKLKYNTTSNLLYHAVQKVASDELAEL